MMKRLVILFFVVLSVSRVIPAEAQNSWGLGLILGEPTGVTYKNWLGPDRAIDAAAAWSFSGYDSFQIHADYLFHNFTWTRDTDIKGNLPLYYGIGARLKLGSTNNGRLSRRTDARLGVRIPGGLSYLLEEAPVELFVEIVPLLDLVPATHFDLNGAIGARYYFE
jgi:hypothetical protein